MARGYVLTGATANATKAFQDFFELWKNADRDIPVLKRSDRFRNAVLAFESAAGMGARSQDGNHTTCQFASPLLHNRTACMSRADSYTASTTSSVFR